MYVYVYIYARVWVREIPARINTYKGSYGRNYVYIGGVCTVYNGVQSYSRRYTHLPLCVYTQSPASRTNTLGQP